MAVFPDMLLGLLTLLLICKSAAGHVTWRLNASSESLLRSHRVTTHPKLPLVEERLPECG